MVRFVESEQQLYDFIEVIQSENSICFPIFENQLNKVASELSYVYFLTESGSKYALNRTHLDATAFDVIKLLKTLKFQKKCYVHGLKWVFELFNGEEIYDLQSVLYYQFNEVETFKYLHQGQYLRNHVDITNRAWMFAPMLKTIEAIDASLNPIVKQIFEFEVSNSFKKYSKAHAYIFSKLEKPGIETEDGIEYCNYNQYTATGRPANTNGKYNFLALNKRSGVRKKFISRHRNGRLFQYDYSAYHFRLIANIIGYSFPKDENVHEYIGKKILNKTKLTKKEYEQIKATNFGVLYGKDKETPNIEFFNKMSIYKRELFKGFLENGYIETIVFKRPILKENHEDMTDNKLFNYLIQSYETERNMMVIYKLINLLENKLSKLILYSYDGFLFDYNPKDGEGLLTEIKQILEDGNYPVKIESGINYQHLEEYEI